MSVQIANINTSAFIVGTTGTLSWGRNLPPPTIQQQMRPQAGGGPTIVLYNESGCLFTINLPVSGESFTLPAGRWAAIPMPPNEVSLNYTVSAIPPAGATLYNNLLADYYNPGEPVDHPGVLGNSPIGATTTTTQQLYASDQTHFIQGGWDAAHTRFQIQPNGNNPSLLALDYRDAGGVEHDWLTCDGFGNAQVTNAVGSVAGLGTSGAYGVPVVCGAVARQVVVTTGSTLIISATPSVNTVYRISAFVRINNGTSGNLVSFLVTFWDPDKPGGTSDTATFQAWVGTSPLKVFDGSSTSFLNNYYTCVPITVMHTAGKAMTVTYNDPTNTPNDHVTVVAEAMFA